MRTHIFPRNFGHDAFSLKIGETNFRVYKVEYFFSTVGEAWVLEFFVSFRDLARFQKSKYAMGKGSFWIADVEPNQIREIVCSLKKTGTYVVKEGG